MLEKIISGGQTGVDQAGWRAAKSFGVSTGGRVPAGFLMEDGPRPDLAEVYGAAEVQGEGPLSWAEENAQQSDATLWFGETTSQNAQQVVGACHRFGKPCLPLYPAASFEPSHVASWLSENEVRMLNVAGQCESESPGIGVRVERFLGQVLRLLGHEPV
jgi:hypothetical protein